MLGKDIMRELIEAIKDWLIHKFSIHCDDCIVPCASCETFRILAENQQIIIHDLIEKLGAAPIEEIGEESSPEPIRKHIPWRVMRQKMESDSFEEARKKKSVEELEKEMGINNAS